MPDPTPDTFKFIPEDAASINVAIGIHHLLSGYIIQDENISGQADILDIPDQQGRTCQRIAYQKYYNVSLTVTGPVDSVPCVPATTLSWYGLDGTQLNYQIDSCNLACVYNDTAKWSVTATAFPHASYRDATDGIL